MSMEEWTGFELSDEVLEEAAQWISVLDDIESTKLNSFGQQLDDANNKSNFQREKLESFNKWLSAHPQHQQAYAEMSLLWAKSACMHEISDRLCASNVFPLSSLNHLSNNKSKQGAWLSIEEFKNSRLPIIQPYHQDLTLNDDKTSQSSPAWAYALSICLIAVGLCSPFIQQIF